MLSELDYDANDGSDEEGEAMTAGEVIEKLEEAWLNEKFAPELLENKAEIVDCVMEQINIMEENLSRAKKGDFKISIHRMEIDRLRYILSSYLRSRLQKIEKYTSHILEEDSKLEEPKLTPEELVFAKDYQASLENHLKALALRHMPPNLQQLNPKQTVVRPNADSYVFLKVKEDVEGVMVEEETAESREEIIDLEEGDQHILRYRPIQGLVTASSVSLI